MAMAELESTGGLAPSEARLCGPCVGTLVFTGRGGEYFRIWVVNLLLTVLTVGIYSAWAKVRKAQYFRRNTWLDGHVFDYHGRPGAILRGRLLGAALLVAYTWAFQFSLAAGLVTVAGLSAAGPWLFMKAQQFALMNTSFRGLRFGFRARTGEAYRAALPLLALWFSPSVADAAGTEAATLGVGALALGLPWTHHRLKAFQHGNATYGDRGFTFTPATRAFYAVYGKGLALIALGSLGTGLAFALLVAQLTTLDRLMRSSIAMVSGVALAGLLLWIVVWPYFAARLQQVVWDRTRLADVRFGTNIRTLVLMRLVVKSALLTLVTAGLYWPWAAVALARYRVECMRVESEVPLSTIAAGVRVAPVSAAGEGASEVFGFEIGL